MREIGRGEKEKKGEEDRKRELSPTNRNLERFSSFYSFNLTLPVLIKERFLVFGQ